MNDLKDIRQNINEIDKKMAELFEERMALVGQVARYKIENNLPVFDEEREKEVLSKGASQIEDESLKPYFADFLKHSMDVSKQYQRDIIGQVAKEDEGKVISVDLGKESYNVYLGKGNLNKAKELFDLDRRVLVVTDDGVPTEYVDAICKGSKETYVVTIPMGEASKNLETFAMICQKMLDYGFTRKDCVVAVGGGVVGDLAGFAAASFMRGIDFYNVPTTLLSQVDSSVGGKTAIDFCGIKNIVGAIHQPKAVLIDPDVLVTLDERQFACGCAEIIKIAATFDAELFGTIEKEAIKDNLEELILRAVKIKAEVIQNDPKELGLRKVLNFGHTLGHAIESVTELLHGECVAVGMMAISAGEVKERLAKVLKREGLPLVCDADVEAVVEAAMHDKKSEGDEVTTVVVDQIGTYRFQKKNKEQLANDYREVLL